MISIHQNKVINIQSLFLSEIGSQRTKAILKLNTLYQKTTNNPDRLYLNNVISLFVNNPDILFWDSKQIKNNLNIIGNVPLINKTYKNGTTRLVKSPIKNAIIIALGYKSLRSSFYPRYFKKIGIKSCVYCNSQLTISAVKSKNFYSAKFDVDHYHSKDEYPFLSICLFNLYPSCSSCNRTKGTQSIEFELYTANSLKTKKSQYKFKLNSYSKSKYLTTKDSSDIDFTFNEPAYSNPLTKKLNDVFHIESIYETQIDLIEELIIKSQIYNKSYLKSLKSNFSKLSLNPELFKRTLIGNYTEDKDIHKRPMSKLVMDIAKDLGLI